MFALTAYNLITLRSQRPRTHLTRTTLALVGFSLLGVAVVAVFGLSGQGVRDLRSQVVASIATLVSAIAGFYFGTRAAQSAAGGAPTNAAPIVTGLSQSSGLAKGGDSVTVTGSGFSGATGVNFGTVAASNLAVASDIQLTVTSPPGTASTTVHVTVTTPAGTSVTTPADEFTYN
jgi:IPT/TIG domain